MTFYSCSTGLSFSPNYFSLEDILASQIRVPCKTEVELPKFGFLEPSLNQDSLPSGTRTELPLWAVKAMAKPSRRYVSATLPSKYQETYREVLKADATVVDLSKLGPYFYESGLHLATLPNLENEQLAEILPNVLKLRLQKMAASYSYSTDLFMADEATMKEKGNIMKEATLDALELKIYKDAKRGATELKEWLEHENVPER